MYVGFLWDVTSLDLDYFLKEIFRCLFLNKSNLKFFLNYFNFKIVIQSLKQFINVKKLLFKNILMVEH